MGMTLPMLEAIGDTIRQIATKNKVTYVQAAERFTADILAEYEPLTGFEKAETDARRVLASVKADIERHKLEQVADNLASEAVKAMHAKGIRNHEIIGIKSTIEASGFPTVSDFQSDVVMYGSLKDAINSADKVSKDNYAYNVTLVKQNALLESHNEALRKESESLQASMNRAFEEAGSKLKSFEENVRVASEQTVAHFKDAGDNIGKGALSVAESIKKTDDIVEGYSNKITASQGILHYEPFARAERGEPVAKEALVRTLVTALEAAIPLLTGLMLSDSKSRAEALLQKLRSIDRSLL